MKTLISALIILASSLSFANTDTTLSMSKTQSPSTLANIKEGNMQIGGGFGWSTFRASGTTNSSYSIHPQMEYFVIDNLSVGGTLSYMGQSGDTSYTGYGLGPSLSYYFLEQGPIAAYVAQAVSFYKYSDAPKTFTNGKTSVGMKYFVVPQVAFGVAVSADYGIGSDNSFNTTSLGGNFSFYY